MPTHYTPKGKHLTIAEPRLIEKRKHLFVKEVPMAKKYELLISEMSYEMDTIIKKRKQVTGN